MTIYAELKKVEGKKQSLDMVYQLVLITEESNVLELGTLPADTLFKVEITHGN